MVLSGDLHINKSCRYIRVVTSFSQCKHINKWCRYIMVVKLFWLHSLNGTEMYYLILALQGASLKHVMLLLYGRHLFSQGRHINKSRRYIMVVKFSRFTASLVLSNRLLNSSITSYNLLTLSTLTLFYSKWAKRVQKAHTVNCMQITVICNTSPLWCVTVQDYFPRSKSAIETTRYSTRANKTPKRQIWPCG